MWTAIAFSKQHTVALSAWHCTSPLFSLLIFTSALRTCFTSHNTSHGREGTFHKAGGPGSIFGA